MKIDEQFYLKFVLSNSEYCLIEMVRCKYSFIHSCTFYAVEPILYLVDPAGVLKFLQTTVGVMLNCSYANVIVLCNITYFLPKSMLMYKMYREI